MPNFKKIRYTVFVLLLAEKRTDMAKPTRTYTHKKNRKNQET